MRYSRVSKLVCLLAKEGRKGEEDGRSQSCIYSIAATSCSFFIFNAIVFFSKSNCYLPSLSNDLAESSNHLTINSSKKRTE